MTPPEGESHTISTSHSSRVARYRIIVIGIFLLATFAAASLALLWPMQGRRIQASFFLSLVGSSLTLFGLVFTLCLIGTQIIATRTKIQIKRILCAPTLLYLGLFLATTLWTLAISYYAGNVDASPRMCRTLVHRICISEVRAGRFSIFGLSWSLILLLPFVVYIYYRLTPRHLFMILTIKALRAQKRASFSQCCRRISDEIASVSPDSQAVTEGLSQLLELGVIGVQREQREQREQRKDREQGEQGDDGVGPDAIAECVTKELVDLSSNLIHDVKTSEKILQTHEEWIRWLIHGVEHPRYRSSATHKVSAKCVKGLAKDTIKLTSDNLRLWATSSMVPARESINILNGIVQTCTTAKVQIRVRVSEPATQLADCVIAKQAEDTRADFNFAFMSLIRLCSLTTDLGSWHLGGKIVIKQVIRVIKELSEINDERGSIASGILDKLHVLIDKLSQTPFDSDAWDEIMQALAALKDDEIRTLLRGPILAKVHKFKSISHAWEAIITRQLYIDGRWEGLIAAQTTAIGQSINASDLPGMLALFDQLANEYIDNNTEALQIKPLLTQTADCIRSSFRKRDCISSSRKQRFTERHGEAV